MPWFVVWDSDNIDREEATGLEAGSVEEAAELYMDKEHNGWGSPDEWPDALQVIWDAGTPQERTHLVAMATDWEPVFTATVLDPAAELGRRSMARVREMRAVDMLMGRPATPETLDSLRGIVMGAAQQLATRYQLRDLDIREVSDLDKFTLEVSMDTKAPGNVIVTWKART